MLQQPNGVLPACEKETSGECPRIAEGANTYQPGAWLLGVGRIVGKEQTSTAFAGYEPKRLRQSSKHLEARKRFTLFTWLLTPPNQIDSRSI